MQLGMVGLGKMGANMTQRLIEDGHEVVVTDLIPLAIEEAVKDGATGAEDLATLVKKLDAPRAVWVMVPAGVPTQSTIDELANLLEAGDIIINGGNSYYKDAIIQAEQLGKKGLHLVDVGTSGGVWGLKEGYSMMIGGEKEIVDHLSPIFETLAPAADKGWGYVGSSGAGHFVKMIHNGIEYGMMQAYAEGFSIMKQKPEYDIDLAEVSRIWQDGSVVRSWLLDLMKEAFDVDQDFEDIVGYVNDSGEGRWTVFEAIDLNVSAPVITESLLRRIRSREEGYTDKLLSVMRNQFGGHKMMKEEDE
ncbi:decarboxylating 6-phosphogluconate dehydrogenase [Phototrophicus methaneseepsis]|uniref:Decarboxylating 6-phosphogluconate dehydrogenase n=1 Tax=Phototrophicus methaneseepsis TaxID=2710758 RepID=A0A7S8IE23_9CHLR|nr:decarboxylating 6-phosphogluconate dehydrogenase [Phototrophicus methaneseepsis]QPC81388.1 decarboxylating 6-phosphogluconate dehydrogenase [Phototrophicus methaneseepsis]